MQKVSRRGLLILALPALAGCVAKPIVLDRQAAANIKRVGLPTIGFPSSPTVSVINAVGNQLGLIGLAAGASVRANRRAALSQIISANGFDARAVMLASLTRQLAAHGITAVPFDVDPNRTAFLPAEPASPAYDAVLDIFVSEYGFIAWSDSDNDPYRATVDASVRLVAMPSREVLMQDVVEVQSSQPDRAASAPPPPQSTFATFTELQANPTAAVAALSAAFDDAAAGTVRRLT